MGPTGSGTTGSTGATGSTGTQGAKGDTGTQGANGTNGAARAKGATGSCAAGPVSSLQLSAGAVTFIPGHSADIELGFTLAKAGAVKHRSSGEICLRWIAAGMLEAAD